MALTLDQITQHMVPYEGNVSYMYLDTVGKVTVGIGNLLPDAGSAQRLPFVVRGSSTKATADQIKADFDAVHAQPKAQHYSKYQAFTKLDLLAADVEALFAQRVASFMQQLRAVYPDYDAFPDPAKLALLDMAFNLGTSGLKNQWPKLNMAVRAHDWHGAAQNCLRPQAQESRNAKTKALFEAAATSAAPSQV